MGQHVASLGYDDEKLYGFLEYTPEFVGQGVELAPITMPVKAGEIYSFRHINPKTFFGLPGMVADSLPDRFGNSILNQWMIRMGRTKAITPLERLQYTGTRGMGALEYRPQIESSVLTEKHQIEIDELRQLAQDVVHSRSDVNVSVGSNPDALKPLIAVGTSAGGARPKAVLGFNSDFSQAVSGQVDLPKGFEHYLMKFDGVTETNQNEETFGDPQGYGVCEYVYYLMAQQCGIDMMPCHLLEEGSRRHFLTKRFDRVGNQKIHVQTLTAIAHVDYQTPGSFSYEELFQVARQLKLPKADALQIYKRMCFNIMAMNNDDHSKNFAFMLKDGRWRLSPAYDVAYCYAPNNPWVNQHWMSAAGKRKGHTKADLLQVAKNSFKTVDQKVFTQIIDEVAEAISEFKNLATTHNMPKSLAEEVQKHLW
nr:type II toxin-antitoxin system HipA family toxin [Marinicella rhabdoformis]